MPAQVHKRAAAKRDLVEHYVYLAEHAGMETAERFLLRAEESFAALARYPAIGVALRTDRTELAGMRKWQVNEFEKFLVFYLPGSGAISIVRVLHAARDWWNLLGIS